jgi:hypothetical protein
VAAKEEQNVRPQNQEQEQKFQEKHRMIVKSAENVLHFILCIRNAE